MGRGQDSRFSCPRFPTILYANFTAERQFSRSDLGAWNNVEKPLSNWLCLALILGIWLKGRSTSRSILRLLGAIWEWPRWPWRNESFQRFVILECPQDSLSAKYRTDIRALQTWTFRQCLGRRVYVIGQTVAEFWRWWQLMTLASWCSLGISAVFIGVQTCGGLHISSRKQAFLSAQRTLWKFPNKPRTDENFTRCFSRWNAVIFKTDSNRLWMRSYGPLTILYYSYISPRGVLPDHFQPYFQNCCG